MKKLLTSIMIIFISTSLIKAQSTCSTFYPFTEGATTQITTYNKRGKVSAVTTYKVQSKYSDGQEEIAKVQMRINDKKGKLIGESEYDMTCTNNTLSIDINSLMNPQLYKQFNDFDVNITGTNIVIPDNLSVGQELPDAEMKVVMDMAGVKMKMSIKITNRKVETIEPVTTPVGTFDCYVISYQTDLKMGLSRTSYSKQWIAKKIGLVKQEDYNKRGKVMSSSLLTKVSM